MPITRTPSRDFAVSRFAVDPDLWLDIVLGSICEGDEARLQDLYDTRSEAQRDEDGHSDWDAYLASGLPALASRPPPELPPLPPQVTSISPRQLRLTLAFTGVVEADVDQLLNALPAPGEAALAMIEWKHATYFTRNDPLVLSMAEALGYSVDELDALWDWAQTL